MRYREEDYLMISGLQHFSFCRRQWALIHIEQQWQDNLRTTEGNILHERAHDQQIRERRGEHISIRGLRVASSTLGISGICDVVEFTRCTQGIKLHNEEGCWSVLPIEYKRGTWKENDADRLQVCAQAMCLEEMLGCRIETAALYYGEIRGREQVPLSEELRSKVRSMLQEMRDYYSRGYTPKVKTGKHCNACSMKDICVPMLNRRISVKQYIQQFIREEEGEKTS